MQHNQNHTWLRPTAHRDTSTQKKTVTDEKTTKGVIVLNVQEKEAESINKERDSYVPYKSR